MSVIITATNDTGTPRLAIAGKLTSGAVSELERACGSANDSLVLDVSDLRFADEAGVAQIARLTASGARLEGVTPYLELLLQRQTS